MNHGYIYCFSNPSMPGILKVGITKNNRTPKDRVKELFKTSVPEPFKIEFAKKVLNPAQKEKTLHTLLEQYVIRVNTRREFFRVSPEEVSKFFELMDGEMYDDYEEKQEQDDDDDDDNDEDEECQEKNEKKTRRVIVRDMTKLFTNGQRIRHTIGINKTWIGIYDSSKNGIVYHGNFYKSLSGFAETHHSIERPDRCKSANGWKDCEYEVNGEWISTKNL